MEKTKEIAAIATLISILNFAQSHAYVSEMDWDNFKANSTAGEMTKKYYMGGDKIKYECIFDNKKENGTCKEFYKNGHLAKEIRCTNNGKATAFKIFFENGKLASEGQYTNGQKNSTVTWLQNYN